MVNQTRTPRHLWVGAVLASTTLLLMAGCPLDLSGIIGGGGTDPNDTTTDPNDMVTGNDGLTGKFVGSETCGNCHRNTHQNWAQTLHAGALETLEAIGQADNAVCLPCHVVGFGQEGGFTSRAMTNALAGVGCESCHGASGDHVNNVVDATLRPTIDISSEVCGVCHTGEHHPHIDEWMEAGHSGIDDHVAEYFSEGARLNACGKCHSGDMFYMSTIMGETVADDALEGTPVEQLNAIECAICHDPHMQTGNAPEVEDGRDFQLRFPEVANPTPTNTSNAAQDTSRFNICGQCHHSRGRDWTSTSRSVHHSIQANVYTGEMPLPPGPGPDETPEVLVFSRVSVHAFATEQCATCHMYRQDFQSEEAPAIAGHTFEVNYTSCATAGCHPSGTQAENARGVLVAEIQGRLDAVKAALDAWGNWEYASEDGALPEEDDCEAPDCTVSQADIPNDILKARYLYYYALNDGSLGIHNPAYVRDMLIEAADLVAGAPAAP
jgi:formate-dependent nitrite reductase cytochrome c552 subunit